MSPKYVELVNNNLQTLGTGTNPIQKYTASKHSKLRYKFKNSENIKENYSHTYQDMFVLSMLDGKKNGTYLEIGSADPFHVNNTALLETNYNWTGVSLEILPQEVEKFRIHRKNKVVLADATKVNYNIFIQENFNTTDIDYLQIDCEPPSITFEILKRIPFEKYRFAVITFEHDHYLDTTQPYREESRKYLQSKGYQLIVSDIAPNNISNYEDWWIHPDLVDPEIVVKMKDTSDRIKNAEKYMLNKLN